MTTPTQAPAPDELVRAVLSEIEEIRETSTSLCSPGREAEATCLAAHSDLLDVMFRLQRALSLPRRTEAELRADERERLAKKGVFLIVCEVDNRDNYIHLDELPNWLRSQGGDDGNGNAEAY